MVNRAIVIGIDNYAERRLTSAVNDAVAVADAFVAHGLVTRAEVRLLTSPGTGATRRDIKDAIYDAYRAGGIDRLFFFFAGHGLLLPADPGRTMYRTALLPSDVRSIDRDGDLLISFDEVFDLFKQAGPDEQLFIVDACRELLTDLAPTVGALGLAGLPPGPQRRQAALFAVSPLGLANGVPGGHGVMTSHLLAALRGEGVAKHYDLDRDAFVVTAASVHEHVRAAVLQELAGIAQWRRRYMTPQFEPRGEALTPLRVLGHVPPVPFTVHIEPEEAVEETRVELSVGQMALADYCLPPRRNHEAILLSPQRYAVKTMSRRGVAVPERHVVDVRTTSELAIRIDAGGAAAASPDGGVEVLPRHRGGRDRSTLVAEAHQGDPAVVVRAVGLEPPYLVREARGTLSAELPRGAYRVSFRLGTDVFSVQDVFVTEDETLRVIPTATRSPLGRELLGPDALTAAVTPSESIGPMQGALLPTMLPLLALRQFDRSVLGRFDHTGAVHAVDPFALGGRPVSVVVALDGDWPDRSVLVGAQVSWRPRFDGHPGPGMRLGPLAPAASGPLGQIAVANFSAPGPGFVIDIDLGPAGRLSVAAGHLDRRATIVCVTVQPDGQYTLSQNLLALTPGKPDPFARPIGRVVRDLQIGQQLYAAGELSPAAGVAITDLLYAKWTDPILGCMGWHAARATPAQYPLAIVVDNLRQHFGRLADVMVIDALHHGTPVLHHHQPPLLAQTLRALVEERGHHEWRALLRRLDPDQPWTCTRS